MNQPSRALIGITLTLVLGISVSFSRAAAVWRGKVIAVVDGDTVTILKGTTSRKVRLYGIDAPERRQPYGSAARQVLADLVFRQDVFVVSFEQDRYGRHIGLVILPDGRTVNDLLVHQGMAWVYRAYTTDPGLIALEAEARAQRRGLWGGSEPAIPPWEFRTQKRARR